MIHPCADYWRARRHSPYFVVLPMWAAMWLLVGAFTWPWRHVAVYKTPLTWIPAVLLFIVGILLYRAAGRHFSGAQLGGRPELERAREQRLITLGIHGRIRHPVYVAHFCEMLGWTVGTGLAVCYGLAVFALITGAAMVRLEERELRTRFGDDYREYQSRVPAFLPTFRRPV
jgi:protein-S-isoprenylcysteine O-methyltransferase Ste14